MASSSAPTWGSYLDTLGDQREENDSGPNRYAERTLSQLGLLGFHPSKISLQDVMAVQNRSHKSQFDLPWLILQKLIMLDFSGRESDLKKYMGDKDKAKARNTSGRKGLIKSIAAKKCDDNTLNPLDVFVTIYACCDMVLKQILVQKMFSCRLAVPFISPQLSNDSWLYSLWAFRSIIIEWKNKQQVCAEMSVVCQPVKTVTFLKLGELSFSKSAMLNNIISDQHHHTFWNRECPLGASEHPLANGLVEAQWYLPSGLPKDIFDNVTMFLNLRGDACEHQKQLQVLKNISNAVVCCFNSKDLETPKVMETMKILHGSHANVTLLLEMNGLQEEKLEEQLDTYFNFVGIHHELNTEMISTLQGMQKKTMEDLKQELRETLKTQIKGDAKSIEALSAQARDAGIAIDEDHKHCQRGKELAGEVKSYIERGPMNECKKNLLPLQVHYWKEWSSLRKSQQSAGGKGKKSTAMEEVSNINGKMKDLRQRQRRVCDNLSSFMNTFLENLLKVKDSPAVVLYLQWMKIYLDEVCRRTLPDLQKKYHQKWKELKGAAGSSRDMTEKKGNYDPEAKDTTILSDLRKQLDIVEKTLADSSLGVEHLLREVGQIYEAAHEIEPESMREMVKELPGIVANLLLKGIAMELMDGDAADVPLTWVDAVLTNVKKKVGDKKLFVTSVLGIQSSGKSTLLNTMFGLQFAVSAGRCTRGVYMQLIKVDKGRSDLPYDYVMIIDTEGLRAPELGQEKFDNDNQLATFVIGLGDVTILNIKGENMAELSNVLQIAVHAFLRMKLSDKDVQTHRTCYFIHQNVPAMNAKAKMQQGTKAIQEKLDEMTVEACAMENIIDIHSFNQVIKFDSETNVFHFSDLWYGDPPMAPVNPGYTAKVQNVRDHLLTGPALRGETFLTFSDMAVHIEDLWKAVLSENFVFSFRNSLAAKAYDSLEKTYQEKSWTVEKHVTEWLTRKATVALEKCTSKDDLDGQYSQLTRDLREQGAKWQTKSHSELEQYIDNHNLKEIVIEWKIQKLNSLQVDISRTLETASTKLYEHKENRRIQLLQTVKLAGIDADIMAKARDFAKKKKVPTATLR